ncbi:BT0820 family HAD-type phosphatase [Labilibaculum antarcticum]|uniref:Hydrolase n=1 Tax=Labilibaculum antarcticum TaxID=1717717 RepID=A0A1Y1CEZ4_9BACT|nr:hydrolase [Labilibaculum antarcticum]BAX78880.1 hydrolase [Labilibaculum antarcticum]
MIIAVDFDGTIVQHKYPEIGSEIPFAIESLIALQKEGHQIILWTYRTGGMLFEAVDYCEKRGLEFYCVNSNYPEEEFDDTISRKIYADLYIDDRNFGGLPEWEDIFGSISTQNLVPDKESKTKQMFIRFIDKVFGD